MEYLQVKTPFIERWEKEVLVQSQQSADLLGTPYLDYNRLQDITSSSVAPPPLVLQDDKRTPAKPERKRKAAAAAAADAGEEEEGSDAVRKVQHNAVEKRRRDKINNTLSELKELVPNCRHYATNKASVLHHATEHIKVLISQNTELADANRRLQESNSHLIAELTELHRLLWGHHHQQHQLLHSHSHPAPPPPPPAHQLQTTPPPAYMHVPI